MIRRDFLTAPEKLVIDSELQGITAATEMLLAEGTREDWPHPGLLVQAKDFDLPNPVSFFPGYGKPFAVKAVTVSEPIDERGRQIFGDAKIRLLDTTGRVRNYEVKRGMLLAKDDVRSVRWGNIMDYDQTALFRVSFDELAESLL